MGVMFDIDGEKHLLDGPQVPGVGDNVSRYNAWRYVPVTKVFWSQTSVDSALEATVVCRSAHEAPAATIWQPMETAPKLRTTLPCSSVFLTRNGPCILLSLKDGTIVTGEWYQEHQNGEPRTRSWSGWVDAGDNALPSAPEGWMPLPESRV